jgi:hypothetical protein
LAHLAGEPTPPPAGKCGVPQERFGDEQTAEDDRTTVGGTFTAVAVGVEEAARVQAEAVEGEEVVFTRL